jgi:beta-galactosidase
MKPYLLFAAIGIALSLSSHAAEPLETPLVGAQVFIEPGQTPEQIEGWFAILEKHGMKLARIRMFENYMRTPDGGWDFSLFDHAFRAAEKHHVKVLGTLFPTTPFEDVGGFKFPRTEAHQAEVADYIKSAVTHFKQFSSLYGWVLVNEPGSGKPPDEPLTREHFKQWQASQTTAGKRPNGYQSLGFETQRFLVDHTVWHLDWLAKEVRKYDATCHLHVNNHNIFSTAAEYDFPRWRGFLDSLGGSAHASWHFRYFDRPGYARAMSANCEIIRSGAGYLPWIMTEIQGGNNTYSGSQPMCPTADEIRQWLWTVIGSGGKGAIFWTLNPRASGFEAGEWAMVDFLGQPSDRLTAAGEVAKTVNRHAQLFATAKPVDSGIDVLYIRESLWTEKALQSGEFPLEGRSPGGVMKSAIGCFEALSGLGVSAGFKEIGEYNFSADDFSGRTIILSHQVALPARYVEKLERFVRSGGKLIVDGLTGYYDENAHCVMQTGFPLAAVLGGRVKEFKLVGNLFDTVLTSPALTLPSHCWRGTLAPTTGKVIGRSGDEVVALRNHFGKGETLWVPSLLGLGSRLGGSAPLTALLAGEAGASIDKLPFSFEKPQPGMLMKTLRTDTGYLTVLIHKGRETAQVALRLREKLTPSVIFADHGGRVDGSSVILNPEETLVIRWDLP